MKKQSKYKFVVSLSLEKFIDKTICNAMIMNSTDKEEMKEIRTTRKLYGFPSNHGISYKEIELTSSELCEKLLHGHVFCQCMEPRGYFDKYNKWKTGYNKNGSFYSGNKTNENFSSAYLMCVDIDDEFSYKSIKSYIRKLRFKPTFYYTTYSHKQPGKGLRFRLIYVLDKPITGSYLYYRYCNYKLNCLIEEDTKTIIKDKCNLVASQYFNGTYIDNPDFNVEYKITNIIYSLSDFDIYTDNSNDYANFLKNNAAYKSITNEKQIEIEEELFRIKPELKIEKIQLEESKKDLLSDNFVVKEILKEQDIPTYFIKDLKQLSYKEFREKYHLQYIYRNTSDEWYDLIIEDTNYKWQNVPDNYFELDYFSKRVKKGHRTKILFQRMCLRRLMKPWLTAKEILFNAYIDLYKFIDNTSDLITIDDLVTKTRTAMTKSLDSIRTELKSKIEDCFKLTPKYEHNILFASGINYRTGLHYWLINRFDELYDNNKSVNENLNYINQVFKNENRKPISKGVLYNYIKGLKQDKKIELKGKELKSQIDFSKGIKWNLNQLRSKGYKINQNEVTELINKRRKQREYRKRKKEEKNKQIV